MSGYRTFLVPFDFSDHSRTALSTAIDLAAQLRGEVVHVVHVVQPPFQGYGAPYGASLPFPIDMLALRDAAMNALTEAVERLGPAAVKVEARVVDGSNIAATIQETASELGADMIVLGTHGRTGLAHAFLGSVAERTLRHASCPVLTVRAPESAAA